MTEAESANVFETLSGIVREHQLAWILEQVNEQIRFGIEEKKSVSVGRDDIPFEFSSEARSRQSKVMFAATRPYTEREKLLLLVDSVLQAVVHTSEMEASFREAVQDFKGPRTGIIVREELDPKVLQVSAEPDEVRLSQVRRLGDLLNELRSAV